MERDLIITLKDIGIAPNLSGYRYILDAVRLVRERPDILKAITKELYPTVAKANNTTPSRVEKAIRHSIETAWNRGKNETMNKLFSYINKEKPTNSEFIAVLAMNEEQKETEYALVIKHIQDVKAELKELKIILKNSQKIKST